MSEVTIRVINRSKHPLPTHQTMHAAAVDIRANIDEPVVLGTLERVIVPTGLYLALPPGYEAQIRPRSGLAAKHGVSLVNYRGELGILLINLSNEPFTVEDGDRIAQMVVAKCEQISWNEVDDLEKTSRDGGGFGHTGVK